MITSIAGEKFSLEILRLNDVLLHEECEDNRYRKLAESFKKDGFLSNPLIVGKAGRKYILLDGANRYQALKITGAKLILAQIVDYRSDKVKLRTWNHFVAGMSENDLRHYVRRENIKITGWDGKTELDIKSIGVVISHGAKFRLHLSRFFTELLQKMCSFSKYYENHFSYNRIDGDISLRKLDKLFDEEGVFFIYPEFGKNHIERIASMKQKLPAGISRHLIPNRVLKLKYDISRLMTNGDLREKNKELEEFVNSKILDRKVRLYKEPVLMFDE
ncbi:MAG: ParB N-terminal domain-containing protein [Ignavibacteria bacterium]|nr:ParB N-terminal domain-containing protein [Ignavibacteria bacterium]